MEKVIKYLENKLQNINNHIELFGKGCSNDEMKQILDSQIQFITAIELLKGCEWQNVNTGENNALLPDVVNCPECGTAGFNELKYTCTNSECSAYFL